ncbi:hypothetical protein KIW84_062916 [Lathyrus oleraceus]|uniref:DUF7745 domain-containing protein n=1 Tax=Pisum sativum TaxID=3888 RepID=A0A9D4W9N5_PEA|nr:hypothetical protein KIW84_062916 [Pisum sativum]
MQLGYPMENEPRVELLKYFILPDMGTENPTLLQRVKRSWTQIHRKGKELGKCDCRAKEPYRQWVVQRAKELHSLDKDHARLKRKSEEDLELLSESKKKAKIEEDIKEKYQEGLSQADTGQEENHQANLRANVNMSAANPITGNGIPIANQTHVEGMPTNPNAAHTYHVLIHGGSQAGTEDHDGYFFMHRNESVYEPFGPPQTELERKLKMMDERVRAIEGPNTFGLEAIEVTPNNYQPLTYAITAAPQQVPCQPHVQYHQPYAPRPNNYYQYPSGQQRPRR